MRWFIAVCDFGSVENCITSCHWFSIVLYGCKAINWSSNIIDQLRHRCQLLQLIILPESTFIHIIVIRIDLWLAHPVANENLQSAGSSCNGCWRTKPNKCRGSAIIAQPYLTCLLPNDIKQIIHSHTRWCEAKFTAACRCRLTILRRYVVIISIRYLWQIPHQSIGVDADNVLIWNCPFTLKFEFKWVQLCVEARSIL